MTPEEIGTAEQRRSTDEITCEITWRHVWLTNVLIDVGRPSLVKTSRPRAVRRMSLTRRLDKLHRLRATLESPRS